MKLPPLPVIICDTREQKPYEFAGYISIKNVLETGDYSLQGYESEVTVERKEKSDAWACVGGSRERFKDCLRRLRNYSSPAIVIEGSLDEFAIAPPRTRLTASQAVNTWISWSQEFRIPVFWCPSRAYAERVTLRWLQAWWRHHNRELAMQNPPPQVAPSVCPVLR